jgi:hypothetical protein
MTGCIVLYLFQIPTDPCTGKRTSHKTTVYRKCHNYVKCYNYKGSQHKK